MNKKRNNRGFILLLVVALIPLVGMVVAIISTNSKTLAFQTRRGLLKIHAQNACDSGVVWANLNRQSLGTLKPGEPLTLPIPYKRLTISCEIEIIEQLDRERVVQITGFAKDNRLSHHVSRKINLLHN